MELPLPVTLVIKAPNQRVGDQTVDCMLDWTVRKLKQHLTDVYPSKPNETQQKLIYSGKLLQDHLTLKEVLRQFDDGSTKHTVHLVCAASHYDNKSTAFTNNTESHSRQSSSSSSQSSPEADGLRHRGHRNPAPSGSQYSGTDNPNAFNPYSPQIPAMNPFPANMNHFGAGFSAESAMFAGMMPEAGMTYSPEQYMLMQQMYAQYMAQYMQYYQQGVYPPSTDTPVSQTSGQGPIPQQQNAQENVNQQQDNVADDMEDINEEFRQRDWLDYLYTFSRFMVLLGIVYFYSNLTRFLMVAAFFVVIYAYQMGWFIFRRRQQQHRRMEQNRLNEQNVPERQENEHQEQQQNNAAPENPTDPANPADGPAPPEQPREPGVLQLSWTFVSMFFTSLFPSPPPAVNVN